MTCFTYLIINYLIEKLLKEVSYLKGKNYALNADDKTGSILAPNFPLEQVKEVSFITSYKCPMSRALGWLAKEDDWGIVVSGPDSGSKLEPDLLICSSSLIENSSPRLAKLNNLRGAIFRETPKSEDKKQSAKDLKDSSFYAITKFILLNKMS